MQNLPSRFDMIYLIKYINLNDWKPTRKNILLEIIKEDKHSLDKYSFACDIMSPAGAMLITHIFDTETDPVEGQLLDKINGVNIDTLIITKIILGSISNRLFDKKQTKQYEILISNYNYTENMIIDNK